MQPPRQLQQPTDRTQVGSQLEFKQKLAAKQHDQESLVNHMHRQHQHQ
jgi:hypothetical protein